MALNLAERIEKLSTLLSSRSTVEDNRWLKQGRKILL